ncbi:MAG TPA: polysaccharide deacetylase family protein [Thermoleophilia bacterium]
MVQVFYQRGPAPAHNGIWYTHRDMRQHRVLRFLIIAFAAGAFIGLVGGLAFGGSKNPGSSTPTTQARSSNSGSATSSTAPTASSGPMTVERARTIGANEMGEVPVLMYHLFGTQAATYTRTPQDFRSDIALLKSEGFYPITVRDLASGNIDIPAGKSPVVLTFDDSSMGQYKILDDGTLDPDSAVGIMRQAVKAGGWADRATFFPLLDVDVAERVLWGQPDKAKEKLKNLIQWGYEVGSHTVTHLDLKKASVQEAAKQLQQSQATLEDMIGSGYKLTSLSVPYGDYPANDSLIASGQYQGKSYAYSAAVEVAGGPSLSPFSGKFRPLHITRITATGNALKNAIDNFKKHPLLRYISDGDPTTVSAPKTLPAELGTVSSDLGRPVIRY